MYYTIPEEGALGVGGGGDKGLGVGDEGGGEVGVVDGLLHHRRVVVDEALLVARLQPEPFNFTLMAVNSISSGSPHLRPMGRTCGEPGEIKKNTHPKYFTALFRERTASASGLTPGRGEWRPLSSQAQWLEKGRMRPTVSNPR